MRNACEVNEYKVGKKQLAMEWIIRTCPPGSDSYIRRVSVTIQSKVRKGEDQIGAKVSANSGMGGYGEPTDACSDAAALYTHRSTTSRLVHELHGF